LAEKIKVFLWRHLALSDFVFIFFIDKMCWGANRWPTDSRTVGDVFRGRGLLKKTHVTGAGRQFAALLLFYILPMLGVDITMGLILVR
jgi:hypothetical protein